MSSVRLDFSSESPAGCARRLLVRIERECEDFIVSPLLGEGRLCESCWINRRVATLDPAELHPRASSAAELIAAFQAQIAVAARPESPQQRATMARILRERHQEARMGKAFSFPPALSRIPASGNAIKESVLPLPGCKLCGDSNASHFTQALSHVVGRAAGIVAETLEVPSFEGEPAFPYVVVSRLANTFLDLDWPFWCGASGKGATIEAAVGSAIGESLERYAARIVSQPLITARAEDLDSAIHPCRLTGVDCSQAQTAGYLVDGEIAWVRGTSIHDRKRTSWLPASAVYLRLPPEYRTSVAVPCVSNGLACAPTLEQAIHRALAEVVERHEFYSVWYGVREVELVDAGRFIDDLTVVESFRNSGLEVKTALLAATQRNVIVASASCWPHDKAPFRPGFSIGLGAGKTPESAVRGAILEAAQVYRGLSWALRDPRLRQRAEQLKREPSLADEPYDHALIYAGRSPEEVPSPFGLGPPRAVNMRMALSDGLVDNALFVDLTPRDVSLATGWRVVRVVVPDSFPCHFGLNMIPRAMLRCSPCERVISKDLLHPLS